MHLHPISRKARLLPFLLAWMCLVPLFTGCGNLSELLLSQETDPIFPTVTAEEEYIAFPEVTGDGQWIEVVKSSGVTISYNDPDLANLLANEVENPRMVDPSHKDSETATCITVYDTQNEALLSFYLSEDESRTFSLTPKGNRYSLSPALYALLENQMWRQEETLYVSRIEWDPDNGISTLELRLESVLHTLTFLAYGAAEECFTAYEILDWSADDDTAKIYLLCAREAYSLGSESFTCYASSMLPARLSLSRLRDGTWVVSDFSVCDDRGMKESPLSTVQKLYPYDSVEETVYRWKQADFSDTLRREVLDYLRSAGLSDLEIS